MRKSYFAIGLCMCLFLLWGNVVNAQYSVGEQIEAEDLWENRVFIPEEGSGNPNLDMLKVSHGEDWGSQELNHPSNFLYPMCGNRHWLCDYRVIDRCYYLCCDVYVPVPITIPEAGDYVIYAYVANWADSAVIERNAGCNREDKWECSGWFVTWDDWGLLDKVWTGSDWNVPEEYYWPTYPYNKYCGRFDLDTLSVGYKRTTDCENEDPRECNLPVTVFNLTAGEHTLYLKVADDYTLIDWLMVKKDGDPAPPAEPGRLWETGVEHKVVYKPENFILKQNYPNPFNATTTIEYYLPRTSIVNLAVYNVVGQKVSVLVNSRQSRGHHLISFDASRLPSGNYLYRLEAFCTTCGGDRVRLFTEERDMMLIK